MLIYLILLASVVALVVIGVLWNYRPAKLSREPVMDPEDYAKLVRKQRALRQIERAAYRRRREQLLVEPDGYVTATTAVESEPGWLKPCCGKPGIYEQPEPLFVNPPWAAIAQAVSPAREDDIEPRSTRDPSASQQEPK